MVGLIILSVVVIGTIAIAWASGIDMMKQKHPDYKGEDFLNWDNENNDWDNAHTEGEI
jgi:Na+/citrate or Na+/malate symporter